MANHQQQYREKVSSMISWGHWFALFNIILALVLGSRYSLIADWPASLTGRIYAYCSWLGHFSFIVFTIYLLVLFPLTFFILSQRLLRVIASILATCGLTILLIDGAVFQRFHLHLNPMVWELVVNPAQSELTRDWQLMFIAAPVIFLVELLFATWSWQKLRSLNRQRFARPLVALFIIAFISSHIMYIWADANFYRPITMQRSNLPLSYPMTARRFLEKYGLLDSQEYQRRLIQQGRPDAISLAYPLSEITLAPDAPRYNLLILTVDQFSPQGISSQYPQLKQFAADNIDFTQHFSSGLTDDDGLFGLFYGISTHYHNGVLASKAPSTLLSALAKRHYQFGLFASDGFKQPLYRQALLADYSVPSVDNQTDEQTVNQWRSWFDQQNADPQRDSPWFSWVALRGATSNGANTQQKLSHYQQTATDTDQQLAQIFDQLRQANVLDKTVVVITAAHSVNVEAMQNNNYRAQLEVPLVIHWPDIPAQSVHLLSDHQDVMATLMQRLLRVTTPSADYTQGSDLFSNSARKTWVTSSTDNQLIINTATRTLILQNNGRYASFDLHGHALADDVPELNLLLQVLTEERRFIAD